MVFMSIDALNNGNSSRSLQIALAKKAKGETLTLCFFIRDFLTVKSSSIGVSSCWVTWGIVIQDC